MAEMAESSDPIGCDGEREPDVVPRLLQSEAYARAAFDNSLPPLSEEQLEAQITARMERQQLIPGQLRPGGER
jgi:hypothetical protein